MNDKPLSTCPKERCGQAKWGKGKVKRLIGAGAGIIFKGSGFYITDYRSDKYKEAAKKETSTSSPSSGNGKTSSSDSKPASAPATKPAVGVKADAK